MRAFELGVAVVVLCGGFTACSSHDELTPRDGRVVTTRMADLSPSQAARVAQAREKVRWVGEAHHAAMMVIYEDALSRRRAKKPTPKPGSSEHCRLLAKAGKAAIAILDKARPISRSDEEQNNDLRLVPELRRCFDGSITPGPAHSMHLASRQIGEEYEPEVSGAYEGYLDLMEAQVHASDWTVSGIRAAVNDVLATALADAIPEGDMLALASFADFAESSATEWHAYDWQSLLSGPTACEGERCLMSFLLPARGGSNTMKVIGADLTGCVSGVKSWSTLKKLLYTPAWKALGGACGVRGAIGSGIAILALL